MGLKIILHVSHLKTSFSETLFQNSFCTVRKVKKREFMRMLEPSTSISLRHVQLWKTMWRRCIQATCNNILNILFSIAHNTGLKTINWSHFRTLLSVTNLKNSALGGNALNRIKWKPPFFFFFKCANDDAAPCQWWHTCLGLLTPELEYIV